MDKIKQQALQVAKEIVVKFIEVGRVSPQNFGEIFPAIYEQVLEAIEKDPESPGRVRDPQTSGPGRKESGPGTSDT